MKSATELLSMTILILLSFLSMAGYATVDAQTAPANLEQHRRHETSTVGILQVGDMQSEQDHNLEGERTRSGQYLGRHWRDAYDGGWFAFDMPVDPDVHNAVQMTYWGGEANVRVFDILIDGVLVGTQKLYKDKPGSWFSAVYPIRRELTEGKDTVHVRLQALPGHIAGAVYGCRIIPVAPSENPLHNPIFQGADPDVLLVDNTVWIYPTHRTGIERRFFAYASKDLVKWEIHGPIFDFKNVDWIWEDETRHTWGPGLQDGNLAWAPGVAHKDGKFYIYYSVGPKPSHIGVAVSDFPAGPFKDIGRPLLSDRGNPNYETIDAMAFTDPNTGTSYLYAGGSAGAKLLVYELNDDMISLKRQIEADTPPYFTEGPFMHYRNGVYYLSYSHGVWWDGSYTVRYATSKTPYGPWDYQGVIMQSNDRHRGPGHHSILHLSKKDQWYIIYHRWNDKEGPGPYDDYRKVAIEALEYDENGRIESIMMTDKGVGPIQIP